MLLTKIKKVCNCHGPGSLQTLLQLFSISSVASISYLHKTQSIMSRDAINVLLGGGVRVRVRVRVQRKFKGKIKGTTRPLMAILDSTRPFTVHVISTGSVGADGCGHH